ncbi:MAG: amidohydrolase [Chloroflexi bacterium]|nr:amidohydrolase [Chloroflexota bacterium]
MRRAQRTPSRIRSYLVDKGAILNTGGNNPPASLRDYPCEMIRLLPNGSERRRQEQVLDRSRNLLVLHHANVITMEPGRPKAEAVAIRDQWVTAIGDNDLLRDFQGPNDRSVDCQGMTLVPGFHDAHCHVLAFARSLLAVDCSPESVSSIEDIKAELRERAVTTPPGQWIVGVGYNEFYLVEKRHPNRHDLDAAVPDHPVTLSHRSGHYCVLNTLGLRLAGINAVTPEPPGGVIEREPETGEPNGLLVDMNYFVGRIIPQPDPDQMLMAIRLASQKYQSCGITSLQDATAGNDLDQWLTFESIKNNGLLASRVTVLPGIDSLDTFIQAGLLSTTKPEEAASDVRVGPIKLMITESTGTLFPPERLLDDHVMRAHWAGRPVAIHAIEEIAIDAAVTSLERNRRRFPTMRKFRDRIEHCAECTVTLLSRLEGLQTIIVTQPPFIYYSGERYLNTVPKPQQQWLYRIGSFLRSGLVTAGSSDSPVVPCNPLVGIYGAVTRTTQSGHVLLPQEKVSPMQALAMYTTNAAYSCSQETTLGSIAIGKLADLVLLSDDPTAVEPEAIKDIKVIMTMVGGQVVWEGDRSPALLSL